jgi:hypothetical protein
MDETAEPGLAALEAQLGGPPPDGLMQLSDDQLRDLAQAIADARRRQAAEIEAAGEQALKHIPRLLRVPIRRVLG